MPTPAEETDQTHLPAETPGDIGPVPPAEAQGEAIPEEENFLEDEPAPADPSLPLEFAAAQPELLSRPVPVFPDWADFDDIIGAVARFRVWIDEEGAVLRVELLEATAEVIIDPVRAALLASRYTPVLTPDGLPVRVSFEETVAF